MRRGSVCFVFVGLSADRFNKFAPCILVLWRADKNEQTSTERRAQEPWSAIFFSIFYFSIFSPKKEKKKPMSLVQSFTTGGGALSWALEWWADKPEKRDAMGHEETIWTIEKSEERAGVSWQIYWPYFIHSLGPGFPWLNSAWPSLSLSYYLWGPTKNTGGTAAAEEPNLADKITRSTGNPPAGTARTHKRKIAHGKNISKTWKWNLKKKWSPAPCNHFKKCDECAV